MKLAQNRYLWPSKRFDIAILDLGSDVYEERVVYLAEIIQCLTNLNHSHFLHHSNKTNKKRYKDRYHPPYFLPNLSEYTGHNLQAIVWFNHTAAPHIDDWYTFLRRSAHSIRTAYYPAVEYSREPVPKAVCGANLLHTPEPRTYLKIPTPVSSSCYLHCLRSVLGEPSISLNGNPSAARTESGGDSSNGFEPDCKKCPASPRDHFSNLPKSTKA